MKQHEEMPTLSKQYAERDIMGQDEYYVRHVSAMTAEDLHSKSAIAAELAHRDITIDALREQLRAMTAECDELRAANAQLSERLQGERARILALLSGMHIDEVKS